MENCVYTGSPRSSGANSPDCQRYSLQPKEGENDKGIWINFDPWEVDIPISAQIICEGQKITVLAASLNTHRIAYISMYYKSVARSIVPENGVLVIFAQEAWFASIK